jgi:predicted ATPase/class 3 adenylate cyclase
MPPGGFQNYSTVKKTTSPLTFLFTDFEGSTPLWDRYPEAMRNTAARHDSLLREAIESNRGAVVKTTGDGFHAVFEHPGAALSACLSGLQALASGDWPPEVGTPRVRMGLHSGVSWARAGDYYGSEVNRAARLMDIAHGGQILVSEGTAALLRGHLPPDVSLLDLGDHRLKGLAAPERIFQVCHPDLQAEFPRLNSLDAFRHNLPVQLTSFVGRMDELNEVRRLLSQTRLLTLLGPGGTGKTRLMLQAAAEAIEEFKDGVWLVELAPLADPELISEHVASALEVQEQPGRPIRDSLADFLRRREMLLLLDNVEHLVRESAALAEHLLAHCPRLKILVTGREALFIAGEITLQIPSLGLPERGQALSPAQLAGSEAVALFVERAQAARPDFRLTEENAPAMADLVRRLDGIPLALELAAARLRMLSVEQIAGRLNDRFRLLTGGRRTALPRQQTLQALIDWSWNLLEEDEKRLLGRLSVFASGWNLEAAEQVAGFDGLDVFTAIEGLVNKSLVVVDHQSGGRTRYRMLESIHQYGQEKLLESGEGAGLRDRHAEYFTEFSERMSEKLAGSEMLAWLERTLEEAENARAAREWALENRFDLALRVASLYFFITRYWFLSKEGRAWVGQVVDECRHRVETDPQPEYERGLAHALINLGNSYFAMGDNQHAFKFIAEGIDRVRLLPFHPILVFGLNLQVLLLLRMGEFDQGFAAAEEALALAEEHGLDFLKVMTLGSFTPMFSFRGDHERARDYTRQALELGQRIKNPWIIAMGKFLEGTMHIQSGDIASARNSFGQAAGLFQAAKDAGFVHIAHSEEAHMLRKLGENEQARRIYSKTIPFFSETTGGATAHQLECFAFLDLEDREYERAARLLGAAQAIRSRNEGFRRFPKEQDEFDAARERLAREMGQVEFDRAFEEGGRLTVNEAVDLAVEENA